MSYSVKEQDSTRLLSRSISLNGLNVPRVWMLAASSFCLVVFLNVISRVSFGKWPATEVGVSDLERDIQNVPLPSLKAKKRSGIKPFASQSMLEAIRGTPPQTPPPVILCFGDSLSRGLFVAENGDWHKNHPYAKELNRLLNNESVALAAGVNGELTQDMVERLPRVLEAHPLTRAVIILGGTNDLGHRKPAEEVIANIVKLHKIAHNATVPNNNDPDEQDHPTVFTVAVTIPQARWPFDPQVRLAINAGIRQLAKNDTCHVALLDLESQWNQSVPANAKYWSPDFVHFSPTGYDAIGQLAYDVLRETTIESKCWD